MNAGVAGQISLPAPASRAAGERSACALGSPGCQQEDSSESPDSLVWGSLVLVSSRPGSIPSDSLAALRPAPPLTRLAPPMRCPRPPPVSPSSRITGKASPGLILFFSTKAVH